MRDSLFWRIIAIFTLAVACYIGHGLHAQSGTIIPDPLLAKTSYAGGVSAMTEDTDYFVTASDDGQTVYVWEFNGAREPGFQAKGVMKR